MLPPSLEPQRELLTAVFLKNTRHHVHVVVGARIVGEVQTSPQRASLGVWRTKDHTTDARLHQCSCTHRARLEGHQQGAVVHPPIPPQARRLIHGQQLGMGERFLVPLASVAPPAHRAPVLIENDRRHGDFPPLTADLRQAQQTMHPQLLGVVAEGLQRFQGRAAGLSAQCHPSVGGGQAGQ